MPEREDTPPGARGVFELPIPVPATIHRARRAKPERAVLLVRRPVALPCLTEAEAPPVASPSFPLPRPDERWAAYPRAAALSWIRHDGDRFLRPLVLPEGGPVRLADLDARIVRWAAGEEEWHDWPYAADKRRLGTRRLDLVEERGLALRSCSINPDAAHAEAALALAGRFCLVGDALHVRCGEPVLDVVARGLSKGRVTRISVIPAAGSQPDPEVEADVVQTFAGHAAAAASAYAESLASRAGLPALAGAAWELHRPILARDDARDAPGEGLARLVQRSRTEIGGLPRPAVEAWLDLRDASERAPTAAEAVSLLRALRDLQPPRSGRLPTLLDWELLRWEGMPEFDGDLDALRALA